MSFAELVVPFALVSVVIIPLALLVLAMDKVVNHTWRKFARLNGLEFRPGKTKLLGIWQPTIMQGMYRGRKFKATHWMGHIPGRRVANLGASFEIYAKVSPGGSLSLTNRYPLTRQHTRIGDPGFERWVHIRSKPKRFARKFLADSAFRKEIKGIVSPVLFGTRPIRITPGGKVWMIAGRVMTMRKLNANLGTLLSVVEAVEVYAEERIAAEAGQ